ncbi:MAG: hypothetical protein JXB38_09585 [Anaerolineales bacterium]|nr:hypothetical protein [Anaerolineales bacterium]
MPPRLRARTTWNLLVFILAICLAAVPRPGQAAPIGQSNCPPPITWREIRNGNFVVIHSAETGDSVLFAQGVELNYLPALETSYQNFGEVFAAELDLPVSIRIYPDLIYFYCLNPGALTVSPATTHTHVAAREIALIRGNIYGNLANWEARAVNALQAELAILFAEKASAGNAPPGLIAGFGGYAEDPAQSFGWRYAESGLGDVPTLDLQTLWESRAAYEDPAAELQATSAAAYLIDRYGWLDFQAFLAALTDTGAYAQALQDVYGVGLAQIEAGWRSYFPLYVSERWQVNVFHNYDLSAIETLLAAGAYADAAGQLEEAVMVIAVFESGSKLGQAQALAAVAQTGREAGALTGQARQALQNAEYQNAIALANEAESLYRQIEDERRLDELAEYRVWAQEVLDLRAEAAALQESRGIFNLIALRRLQVIGQRLGELGDAEGVRQVEASLGVLTQSQRLLIQVTIFVVIFMVLGLTLMLFFFLRKPAAPEGRLS